MPGLRCLFLGSFRVTLDGQAVTAFESGKVRALLAYLAIESKRSHERSSLASLLWPEQSQAAALQSLRQALYLLRQIFGHASPGPAPAPDDTVAHEPYLSVTRQAVQFNQSGGAETWVDAVQFKELLASCAAHRHDRVETCRDCITRLQEAVQLYGGELLEGFSVAASIEFDEWLIAERESLNRQMLMSLGHLAAHYEDQGQDEQALHYILWQARLEPWREEAHREAMRLLARTGQRAAALAQYNTCRRVLGEALGIEPSRETNTLYERIRDGDEAAAGPTVELLPSSNLPIPATPFIGREAEVTGLSELLIRDDARLVVVTGPAGVGKTRLALQAGAISAGHFRDGVFLVDLATVSDARRVLDEIATSLTVRESPEKPLVEAVKAHLKQRDVLLLLDNFEHVIEAAPVIYDLVRSSPKVKVLVTSRIALPIRSMYEFPLAPMSLPDPNRLPPLEQLVGYESVRLFTERATAHKPAFAITQSSAVAVAEICRRLDGLPLALELAAARIKLLTPQAMLIRLEDRFRLLDSQDIDVPLRQRTLRSAIDWSYHLLLPQEQVLFRRLSVFSGSWTLEATESVAGAGIDVLEALAALVDKSLVRQYSTPDGEARYSLLESIREYSSERLLQSGEQEDLRLRHAIYYLEFAEEMLERSRTDESASFARLELELDNVQSALDRLLTEHIQPQHFATATHMATALGPFWDFRGYWSEGRRWLGKVLAHPLHETLPTELLADALRRAGWLALRQNDNVQAREYLGKSLTLFQELGHTEQEASVLSNLGNVALYAGDYEQARLLSEQSLAIYSSIKAYKPHILTVIGNLATIALFQGNFELAVRLVGEVFEQEHGQEAKALAWQLSQANATLGTVRLLQGDLAEGGALFARGLAYARKAGYAIIELYCLCGCAAVLGAQGDTENGASLLGAFDANSSKLGWAMSSGFRAVYERVVAGARVPADESIWAEAYTQGQRLSLEEAVDLALAKLAS